MPLIKKTSAPAPLPAKGASITGNKIEVDPTAQQTAGLDSLAGSSAGTPPPSAATSHEAPLPSASTAVAPAPAKALMTAPPTNLMAYLDQYKNRLKVQWNTLTRLQPNNGNFLNKDAQNAPLGDTIQLRLMSYQDSYQLAPGGNDKSEEAKSLVRYSDDGETTTMGENCKDYIRYLREERGYSKAKMDHRCVLAGELVASTKESKVLGELVQIDLPKTSKDEFDKYLINCAFKLGKGLLQPNQAEVLTMTCEVVTKGDNSWTVVKFSPSLDAE